MVLSVLAEQPCRAAGTPPDPGGCALVSGIKMSATDPESPVSCQARTNVNLVNNPGYSGLFVVSDNNLGQSLLPTCTTQPWPTRDPQMSSCNQVYHIKK